MYRENINIPTLKKIAEATTSEMFKKAVGKLSQNEQASIINVMKKFVVQEIATRTLKYEQQAQEYLAELQSVKRLHQDCSKHLGFYKALKGEHFSSLAGGSIAIEAEMFEGIEEALDYINKRPDKVVQHYGDPDPKTKVYQHRRDSKSRAN